jgi:hypothetical protein
VYVDEDGDTNDDLVEVTTTTNTFYNVASGVVQGNVYKFQVTATNQKGTSIPSPIASVQAASVPA